MLLNSCKFCKTGAKMAALVLSNYMYACTMRTYGILNIKNTLVKSLYYATEYAICSLVLLG
jgi:hypothetical protein